MINVQNLVKNYGDFKALAGVSFEVPKGQIVGLLGPNGAGKSTTMKIITGFMPATSGTVKLDGEDIQDDLLKSKSMVGYLPENPPLYVDMRVREFLEFVSKLNDLPKENIKQRVDYVIERCGLKEVESRVIGTLSKGFRQRVGIAQALVHDPAVIIMDEPTVGLDPAQIVEIRNLIKSLKGSHTVILSTHILPEVVVTCDRVVLIDKGKVIVDDDVSKFKTTGEASLEKQYLDIISGEHSSPRV